jgi:hypothetical protein
MALSDTHGFVSTFLVRIHGRGLVVRRWMFFRRRLGFYVNRFVEATNAEEACEMVLADVRDEPKLLLRALHPPTLVVDAVEEREEAPAIRRQGFAFYPEPDGASDRVT